MKKFITLIALATLGLSAQAQAPQTPIAAPANAIVANPAPINLAAINII